MCKSISIENVISNYFSLNKNKTSVTFETLSVFKKQIEKQFRSKHKDITIDFSKSSIINVEMQSPEFFKISDNKINFISKDNRVHLNRENKLYFNAKLPTSVRKDFISIMNSVNKQYEVG